MRPLSMVEDPALSDWIQFLSNTCYSPPSRPTVTKYVKDLSDEGRSAAKEWVIAALRTGTAISVVGKQASPPPLFGVACLAETFGVTGLCLFWD